MINRFFRCIVLLVCIFLMVGCNESVVEQKEQVVNENDSEKVVEPHAEEEKTVSAKLGLYIAEGGTRNLVSEYYSDFPLYKDIVSFETYYTNDQTLLNGRQIDVWNHYYDTYKDIPNLKIAYQIKFTTDEGEVDKIITVPSDVESFFNYVQVYLYDDIHQNGNQYSHITMDEYNDETILSSIKLTGSTKIDYITSPITLIVFCYQSGDKIEPNDNNSYQIIIKRK